jgi:predicted secreted protein
MSTTLAVAIYFIVWWITLFAILPFRFGDAGAENDAFAAQSGAPVSPRLGLKFVITTIVASLIFAAIYVVLAYRIIGLDDIPFLQV